MRVSVRDRMTERPWQFKALHFEYVLYDRCLS